MITAFCSLSPQTGKSTCAEYYAEKTEAMVLEFSYPIEIMASKLYGYTGPKSDPKQRKILQDLGLVCKTIDPHYWCWRLLSIATLGGHATFRDLTYESIDHFKNLVFEKGINAFFEGGEPNLLLAGMRSADEADFFKGLGGKVYLVVRDFEAESERGWEDHKVESQLIGYKNFDAIIENQGTIDELKAKIDALIG